MVAGKSISKTRTVRTQLSEVVVHLRQMQSAVVVAVAALRQQNCELDEDIATVLQRSVADRIEDQIERLEVAMRVVSDPDQRK
jgi:membrane carboxypeptidase/penicillin-binding protein PbpC